MVWADSCLKIIEQLHQSERNCKRKFLSTSAIYLRHGDSLRLENLIVTVGFEGPDFWGSHNNIPGPTLLATERIIVTDHSFLTYGQPQP